MGIPLQIILRRHVISLETIRRGAGHYSSAPIAYPTRKPIIPQVQVTPLQVFRYMSDYRMVWVVPRQTIPEELMVLNKKREDSICTDYLKEIWTLPIRVI